ncbi:hypothetical protein QBC35DRAFT_474302 [Podospora australis]|uniref:NACHT domain-containing protein n=1 Tax=Podospora australis TaxID=1536484 RepID=A0AAN7AGE1_9PEZI|nr:hypothetical protein QBC35DRAFT_474302 [Podospora australis]
MQKSLQGLMQSLLFHILRQNTDLIQTLCPSKDTLMPWTKQELGRIFKRISALSFNKKRFCFLIDGLDEYDGEEEDIISWVQMLAKSPHIKILISSRPWNAFNQAFGNTPYTLAMQDINAQDITRFITRELTETPRFQAIAARDPRFLRVIDTLCEMAQGVWLWAFLVARGLKREIAAEESYEHWQRRIEHIPPTLEGFFYQQLERLDPIYKEQTARILLVMLAKQNPLDTEEYLCIEKEAYDINYLDKLPWTDSDPWSRDPGAEEDIRKRRDENINSLKLSKTKAMQHLEMRCKDLIVISPLRLRSSGHAATVDFLHRTVCDFFQTTYYNTLKIQAGTLSPLVSLHRLYIAQLKTRPRSWYIRHPRINQNWNRSYSILLKHVCEDASFDYRLIQEFERLAVQRGRGIHRQWGLSIPNRLLRAVAQGQEEAMLTITMIVCISLGILQYVNQNWGNADYRQLFHKWQWRLPPISLSLPHLNRKTIDGPAMWYHTPKVEILPLLLESGGTSPNDLCSFPPSRFEPSIGAGYRFLDHLTAFETIESVTPKYGPCEKTFDILKAIELLFEHGLYLPTESESALCCTDLWGGAQLAQSSCSFAVMDSGCSLSVRKSIFPR